MWKRSNQNHEQRRGKGKEEGERDKKRDRDRGVSQGNRLRQENRKIRRDNLPSKETGKYTTKEEVDTGKRQGLTHKKNRSILEKKHKKKVGALYSLWSICFEERNSS